MSKIKASAVIVDTIDAPQETESVFDLLQDALQSEYQQWDLYYAYASRLRGAARDSVKEHFEEHAHDESDHIGVLQRYLISNGVTPTMERKTVPSLPLDSGINEVVKLQLYYEKDAVNTYKRILDALEETDPLRVDIENLMIAEQEHVHDLEMLLETKIQ